MTKSFKNAFWFVITEIAIIFASIQLFDFIPKKTGISGFIILLVIITMALLSKYYFLDNQKL